jgi:hypothetical protein
MVEREIAMMLNTFYDSLGHQLALPRNRDQRKIREVERLPLLTL